MNEILMRYWLDTIWLQRAEDVRSLLVLDSFVGNITQSVKRETNTVLGGQRIHGRNSIFQNITTTEFCGRMLRSNGLDFAVAVT